MKFYCPGVIAAPEDKYCEIEELVRVHQFDTPEFLTLHVIFCTDEHHKVIHVEEMSAKVNVPKQIFTRTRELNRAAKNLKYFNTWLEAAEEVRHCARRISAMLTAYKAAVPLIRNSTAIARLIAIDQSWPFVVEETLQTDLSKQACQFIIQVTQDFESLYEQLIPFHTRDIYRQEESIKTNCNKWAEKRFETLRSIKRKNDTES